MKERSKAGTPAVYEPFQSGYHHAGSAYTAMPLSGDCRLGKYVSEFFEVQRSRDDRVLHIIPDGCNDLIIAFDGDRVLSHISPSISEPYQFNFQRMEWIFGVRFLPGATYTFFRDILKYDSVKAVEAELVLSNIASIEAPLCESMSFAKRFEIVTAYLEGKVGDYDGTERLLNYCVNRILTSDGGVAVENLAQDTGYSSRYLRQLFTQHVGHSPKSLASIIRVQKALRYLEEHPDEPLCQTALQFGFSDQSHMNREFKRYLHLTSGAVKEDQNWLLRLQTDSTRSF